MDTESLVEEISKYYIRYLKRQPDEQGIKYYLAEIKNGRITIDDLVNIFKNSPEYKGLQLLNHGCIYTKYGTKMYLDKNDSVVSKTLAINKIWEEDESKLISNIISEGMQIVDVGAQIGYYTLLFSRWVGDVGKVFCFEPDPENYRLLLKNIAANQVRNTVPIQKAVSNHNGKTTLFQSSDNKGDHRINDFYVFDGDDQRKKIEIECVTLDSIFTKEQIIDFVKMDIQGAEMLAIDGMAEILRRNSNMSLLIEFWPFAIEKSGFSPREFIERILQFGFRIFSLEKGKKELFSSDHQIITNYSPTDFVNLFCEK